MTKDEIKVIIEKSKFEDLDITYPEPLITIKDKVILTDNNFITISGLPKARKTTFMQFFIASCLTDKSFFGIKSNLKRTDKVVLIDTEQSIYDFHKQNKFLKKALESNKLPKKFSAYLFREFEPDVILNSIYTIAQEQKPKIIFIDNLTELCINPNDIAEAKKVIQFLKKVTAQFNCGIVCLLHLAKSNSFTLGNLGSYADRGAQSVLRVTLDKETDTSTLDCSMLRSDAHFEPITIQYDTNQNKYTYAENKATNNEKSIKKAFTMDKFTDEEIKSRLDIVFDMQPEYVYSALVENLKKVFGVGDNAIKQIVIPFILFKKYIKNKDKIYTYYKK